MITAFENCKIGLLLALIAPVTIGAQTLTTGALNGLVEDQSAAVIPNARLTLIDAATRQTRQTTTDTTGIYRFPALQPGAYELVSESRGLHSGTVAVFISPGQVATVTLVEKPEKIVTHVTVTDVQLLQQADSSLSTTFSAQQLQLLPLPAEDITTPAFTAPGVILNTGGGYGNFSSRGIPATSNSLIVNGIDEMDPYLNLPTAGSSNLALGLNEIADVTVLQNAYPAQYGRQAGAMITAVTKSGTNAYHADLHWNWNGSALNANDFFLNATGTPRAHAVSNQYAASIGGPLIRNKLFFFADTEGLRYVLPTSQTVSIPAPAFERVVLATVAPSQQTFYAEAFGLYNNAPGASRAVPVTNGTGPLQDSSGHLGCGLLAGRAPGGFGITAPCAFAFQSNATNQNTEWLLSTRADYDRSSRNKLFWRFKADHGQQASFTDAISPLFSVTSNQPEYEGQMHYTFTPSANLVNDLVVAASWYSQVFAPADVATSLAAFPTYFLFAGTGGANGSSNSFTPLGLMTTAFPQGRRNGQGQAVDDLSIVRGHHMLRVGLNYRANRVTDLSPETLTMGGAYVFFTLPEFVLGQLGSGYSFYEQRFDTFQAAHIRFQNLGAYLNDDWRVTPKLHLILGLRVDHTSNPLCTDHCFARLSGAFPTPDAFTTPYNQAIETGLAHLALNTETAVYQPRLGFAWSPMTNKTVVRGGIGLYSDLLPLGIAQIIFNNSPNTFTPQIYRASVGAASPLGAPALAAAANQVFQSNFANGASLASLQQTGIPFTPPNYVVLPNTLRSPKYLEWSFEIQQALDTKSTLTLAYAGNHGYNLLLDNNLVNAYNQYQSPAFSSLPAAPPDPMFRIVTALANNGVSNYDGLTVLYRRTFSRGLESEISYTWSHTLDDISGLGTLLFNESSSVSTLLDPHSKNRNYANSDYDVRHNLTGDFSWALPSPPQDSALMRVFSHWNIAGRVYARTGLPYSIFYSGLAEAVSNSAGGVTLETAVQHGLLATAIDPAAIARNCTSPNQVCFTSGDFVPFGFGNLPRNAFRGPGYFDADLSLRKTIPIHERSQLSIGVSLYNALNHPNFANPNPAANAGGGTITATVSQPASPYGEFQRAAVSGRVIVTTAAFTF